MAYYLYKCLADTTIFWAIYPFAMLLRNIISVDRVFSSGKSIIEFEEMRVQWNYISVDKSTFNFIFIFNLVKILKMFNLIIITIPFDYVLYWLVVHLYTKIIWHGAAGTIEESE